MKKILKVILLIETTHAYGRGLLSGIAKYSNLNGPWSFYRETPFYGQSHRIKERLREFAKLNADGIIVREPEAVQVEQLMDLGIPMIVTPCSVKRHIPALITNADKIGLLAAEHLLKKGFKNFAYCGFQNIEWAQARYQSFVKAIEPKNYKVDTYLSSIKNIFNLNDTNLKNFTNWLKNLPKPVGLMACNDDMGRIVLETCQFADILVPDQVAVVGVDDDELTCKLTDPPLSSVALNSEKAGFDAARLLDQMMHGEPMNGQIISHEPTHVVTRQSTDVIAVEDSDVARAIAYIRHHYKEAITVNDVANAVFCSRRHLYKKFIETMGHSVHREIKKARIEHIRRLLLETEMSIYQITMTLGFTSIEHISRYFQKETGVSPQELRKKFGTYRPKSEDN